VRENYTRYPRPILWLLREGELTFRGPDGKPGLTVGIPAFYISKTPVTNRQYEACDPGFVRLPVSSGGDDPAVGISYAQASDYCQWYARVARKEFRLPTEAEWEYACRGGTTSRYFFGTDATRADDYVWDSSNSGGRVRPPTDKKPNPFGLHGMLGGVWEWTGSRVLRGGSFRVHREQMGSGVRRAGDPAARLDDVGFRIVRSLH
jgi:formylglycine-generating enzyme required for sulfatase activity